MAWRQIGLMVVTLIISRSVCLLFYFISIWKHGNVLLRPKNNLGRNSIDNNIHKTSTFCVEHRFDYKLIVMPFLILVVLTIINIS